MTIKLIDNFVGHDGNSYFCRRCGRAGFKGVAAVRGHQASCAYRKGGVFVPLANQAPLQALLGGAGGAGAGAGQRAHESTSVVGLSSELAGVAHEVAGAGAGQRAHEATSGVASSSFLAGRAHEVALDGDMDRKYWAIMQDINQRLGRMEQVLFNEIPHQLASNKAGNDRWFWIVGMIVLAIGFLQHFGGENGKNTVGKLVSKAGDKALSKGVDKLFGLF